MKTYVKRCKFNQISCTAPNKGVSAAREIIKKEAHETFSIGPSLRTLRGSRNIRLCFYWFGPRKISCQNFRDACMLWGHWATRLLTPYQPFLALNFSDLEARIKSSVWSRWSKRIWRTDFGKGGRWYSECDIWWGKCKCSYAMQSPLKCRANVDKRRNFKPLSYTRNPNNSCLAMTYWDN